MNHKDGNSPAPTAGGTGSISGGELRSHKPHGVAKKKRKRYLKLLSVILLLIIILALLF